MGTHVVVILTMSSSRSNKAKAVNIDDPRLPRGTRGVWRLWCLGQNSHLMLSMYSTYVGTDLWIFFIKRKMPILLYELQFISMCVV